MYRMGLHQPWELLKQVFSQNFECCYNIEVSQSLANIIMKHYYNHQHILKSFNVGDWVYLCLYSSYNIPANWGKNKKIDQQYTGLFIILEKVGCLAYWLKLPSHWNVHDVINITFLEPVARGVDPFDCVPTQPDAVHDKQYPDQEDCYDVEQILTKCERHIGHGWCLFTEYLVQWKGFNKSHDEWLRAEDMEGAQEMVNEFEATEWNGAAVLCLCWWVIMGWSFLSSVCLWLWVGLLISPLLLLDCLATGWPTSVITLWISSVGAAFS